MIAGLPWTSWLLIVSAVVPALVLTLVFYAAHGGPVDHDPDS